MQTREFGINAYKICGYVKVVHLRTVYIHTKDDKDLQAHLILGLSLNHPALANHVPLGDDTKCTVGI